MNRTNGYRLAAILLSGLVILLTFGCGNDQAPGDAPVAAETDSTSPIDADPLAAAAAQATAIVQQAEATALILQAQSEAEATVQSAAAAQPSSSTRAPETGSLVTTPPTVVAQATVSIPIEVLSVGFAAEGGMIQVRFRAPADVADRWLQGSVYLIDETTGAEYKEIPVMPRIGPLFGKPIRDGQPGYVMLINGPELLQPGANVTVVLGNHVEEGWSLSN